MPETNGQPTKLVPITPVSLLDNKENLLVNTESNFGRDQIYDKDSSQEMKDDIGNVIFTSTDSDKKRAEFQSWYEQAGKTLGRVATDFVGGTLQGFGSLGELPSAIFDEVKGQDADFNNGLMQLGRDVEEWGKDKMPIYRQNPGKSWDLSDPAWWFEGAESAFSTLQFLIPVGGAVKGAGALAKLAKAEQLLAKTGANVEKIKYFSKVGIGAVTARNAENMMESFQVRNDVKTDLLQEWANNPSTFEELKDSEIGKELEAEGREVDKENLANFIASKAAWKTYAINSANIMFDAIQLAPLFKGFDPVTRKSRFATSSSVLEAAGEKVSKLKRVGDYLNPVLSGIGRSGSEGLEEAINYIGSEEGKNKADQLTGKDDSSFGKRLGKYLKSGDLYESAFWGVAGGGLFEGASRGVNSAFSKAKGSNENTDSDFRIAEIKNRQSIIEEASKNIKDISANTSINDNDKKDYINRVKSELALDLGLRAAQTGNIDLLIAQVKSPEFRTKLVEDGIAKEGDVEGAISKTIDDITTAEKLYKKYYNSFYTSQGSDVVKNMLINQSVTADYLVQKNNQRVSKLQNEISALKAEDSFMQNTKDEYVENSIQLQALQTARTSIKSFLSENSNDLLSERGKAEIEAIDKQINDIKDLVKDKASNLSGLNPEIVKKQAEIIFAKGINNLNGQRIAEYRDPKTSEKLNKQYKESIVKTQKEETDKFNTQLESEIKDGKHTLETLLTLKKDNKSDKVRANFIDSKIKAFKADTEKKARTEEVKAKQEQAVVQPVNIPSEEDPNSDIPEFEIGTVDETQLNPTYKTAIDTLAVEKDLDQLRGFVGDDFAAMQPYEAIYARNKFQEIRSGKISINEVSALNEAVLTGVDEFEIDESAQSDISSDTPTLENLTKEKETKDKDTSTQLDFLKRMQGQPSLRTYIPEFDTRLDNYNHTHYFSTKNGDIILNDEHVELMKVLLGKDLQSGAELEISIEKESAYYDRNKADKNQVPIKISYKGKTIARLSTIKGIDIAIKNEKKAGHLAKVQDLLLQKPHIEAIRNKIGIGEEVFKTKLIYKGNGTVISRGKKQTSLRTIKGIFKDLYTLKPGLSDTTSLYNTTDDTDFFSGVSELRQGVVYGKLESANGTSIPVPLFISKVSIDQAVSLQSNIESLMSSLEKGLTTEHQEVKDLKDKIAEYIKVDRFSQYDKPVGFRVYPKGVNAEGKATKAKIEMSYYNTKGIRHTVVIKKDDTGVTSFIIFKLVDGKTEWVKKDNGDLFTGDVLDNNFRSILQLKYRNIDLNRIKDKEEYSFDGKTFKSYKDYLVDEEVVKTDISQVLDKKGNLISNLYAFNNDFSVEISPNLYKEGEEPARTKEEIIDETTNLFLTGNYEKEFSNSEVRTNDLEYRKKYKIYSQAQVNAETIVDEILKNALNDNITEVAKWLKKNLRKTPVSITKDDLGYGETAISALYKSLENKVIVSSRFRGTESLFQQSVLHELVHAVTVSTIFNNVTVIDTNSPLLTDVSQIQFKKYAPQYVRDFVTEMSVLRNELANKASKKYGKTVEELIVQNTGRFYGLESVQELISEIMTNPNFRNEVRDLSDNNIITRIYNRIIEFLNRIFGSKLKAKDNDTLKNAVNSIKNFVDNTQHIERMKDLDVVFAKKLQDTFDNQFSREEINEIVNTFEGIVLNIVKNKKLDFQDSLEDLKHDDRTTVRELVNKDLDIYLNKLCPPSCKDKTEKVKQFSYEFITEATRRINKAFKISTAYDIQGLEDTQEVTKDWEDSAALQVSSQDTITNQIKIFVKTTPDLASLNTRYTEDGKPVWDRKKSTVTGMNKYVDFNVIYPYMVRNLIGARTPAEIIARLNKMSQVYPSFAFMATALENNANLLAQIESNMARKYSYDSYVTFLSSYDNGLVVRVDNEAKKTKHDTLLADQWNNNVSKIIDSLDTPEKLEAFRSKANGMLIGIRSFQSNYEGNIEEIANKTFDFANELGVNISIASVTAQLENARNWNDFKILNSLDFIFKGITSLKKHDSYGNLNYLAGIESIFTFDIVENSVLSIDGKPLYTIRNPHFISNWFSLAKSETPEGKEEFEKLLRNYAKVPDMQLSNWLWNEKDKEGLLFYKIVDNKKVVDKINWSFVNKFDFHNFGGAKETTYRIVQKYTDFSDKDWMMINLFNHIQGSKKKGFIQVPSLVPSDSGSMFTLEVPKVPLKKDDFHVKKLSKNSSLFKAMRNTVTQEIRRIQQATEQVFDIVDNKLVPKSDLDINNLQQHFHYGKKISYNEDGTIDPQATLLDENGKPKGKAFAFQNMSIKRNDKIVTLNDVDGIFINHHLAVGEISQSVIDKIDSFIGSFINEQYEKAYTNYKSLETDVAEKHDAIGNGSFEDLILEYILNQYIANIEQFNLFNGNVSEYKDKVDTNKRAKQMYAPGISLSVESMKIILQNKSFSDGRTFKAVTISDIETSSKTLSYMVLACKLNLQKERSYPIDEINSFDYNKILNKKPSTSFEKDVYDIIKGYFKINSGDAQGYCTLDRYEQIVRGLGRWNEQYEATFEAIRSGKQLTSLQLKTLQPLKGFYYGREYDETLNRFSSNQIKYSTIPLIPQLVAGTQLEKLMNKMNKDGIQEAFFESAHKVGAKRIYKINEGEEISDELLKQIKPQSYLNKNWQLQLDVPEHLIDQENLLATQIAKLITANMNANTTYNVNGKEMKAQEVKKHYFDILNQNIIESANKLLNDLGVKKTEEGFTITNSDIQSTLIEEIEKRGLSENYRVAIELDEKGNFKLPLFSNNMTYKWESILTSLFTNRIIKQKMPGGSVVLASRIGLDTAIEQSKFDMKGIEWSKDKKDDKTLRGYRDENGQQVVEVLLGAWTKKLYKDGTRISIDEIPDEIKTMIGYRIPTQAKHSMFVFKVVGFLPEESKGTIITPDDLVVQAGWDFDVDKVFTMVKNFYITDDGKFVTPSYGKEKQEFDDLMNERKTLLSEDAQFEETNSIIGFASNIAEEEIKDRIEQINKRLRDIGEYNEDGKFVIKAGSNRQARENEIFDIYHSILVNQSHLKEIFTPAEFEGFINLKDEIDEIFGEGDNNINPATEEGQRAFRKRNISGRALKGIAANFNSFGAIAQEAKMYLNDEIAFKFKFDLNNYNEKELKARYKDDVEIKDGFAYITFKNLGFAPDGSYLNVNSDLTLEKGSQGIGAAVDIVKNPTFDAFNATTYTYPMFHTGMLSGVPDRVMGMFTRQPIIKRLNDYYFDNKSLLGDKTGNQIETIKRFYQTQLYVEMVGVDKNKKVEALQKTLAKREKAKVNNNTLDRKFLVYIDREQTKEVLGYDPDDLYIFSVEELKEQLVLNSKGIGKLKGDAKIDYLRKQLMILEWFNKYKKAGEGVQDILKATKVDGLGAGPTMMVTDRLNKDIEYLRGNERVLIDGQPAINKIYPNDMSESVYSPLNTYLEYGNNLSVAVLSSLFIQHSWSYHSALNSASSKVNKSLDDEQVKNLHKFLNTSLLQDFGRFEGLIKEQILGVSMEVNNNTDVSYNDFKNLSVANKVSIMQQRQSDYLKENTQHILNFLMTRLDKEQIKENGYHKIDFVFYKNEFTDDNLSDSIIKMYESGDEFQKNLAEDLINYAYVTSGLTFGLNSFSKVVPNELLYDWGLGEHLYKAQERAKDGTLFSDTNIVELFFRNNWNNNSLVPIVRTRWHYKTVDGKREIVEDDENNPTTIDNSPIWDTTNGIIGITDKRFRNLDNDVKNAPYILVANKAGTKLFKKFFLNVEGETGDSYTDKFETEFTDEKGKKTTVAQYFYYQVDKLGKDGISEFSSNSILEENRSEFKETKLVSQLEEIVSKMGIRKVTEDLTIDNIEDTDLEDQSKECGYDEPF